MNTLFDQPPHVATSTSEAAAQEIKPSAQTLRQRVLHYLATNGPSTDERIAHDLGMNPSTQRPRRIELVRSGHVQASLQPGRTSSGRAAIMWEVVQESL